MRAILQLIAIVAAARRCCLYCPCDLTLLAAAACLCFPSHCRAIETVEILAESDTTLSENYPSNNLGGLTFFNSGTTQNYTRNRGLLRFDIASALPSGAAVRSATLLLEVVGAPNEPAPFADFGVHRVLQSWGEGAGVSPANCTSCAGQGRGALFNEATWLHRFALTPATWSIPGGGAGTDYVAAPSSYTTVYGTGNSPYTFVSTPAMVADVQAWVNSPPTNCGWMLICQNEGLPLTARRFGSSEDPVNAARLIIEYEEPTFIDSFAITTDGFVNLYFQARPGKSYDVEYNTSLSPTGWQVLTKLSPSTEPTPQIVVDLMFELRRFYRLRVY